MRCQRIFSRDF